MICSRWIKVMAWLLINGFALVFLDLLKEKKKLTMASEAPSWADQWGAGGIGSMEDDNYTGTKQHTSNKKKEDAKGGLNKAKAAAVSGAQKLKSGASNSFKWVKSKCQKK
ncbi:hypothetical protein POTOM_040370 [Populus tomentosa]|uniref:Uncharacterized protein n=1 Tax=Populus tomentosa TaxID=118781 RepID=A0A8X7YTY8_POPTO|nr:hypothetical protein POTOM_040370 [Populus tomentosa]